VSIWWRRCFQTRL